MRKKLLLSRSGFEKPESREEAIMQNILGASNVLEPSESNIEEILKSILYNTPYTKEAEFEIEKILLAIKNNGTYDGEGESRDMKILIAILNDLDYTEEAESRIEELFIEWLHQRSSIKVLEGIPPLTFTSLGLPLINYLIEGNTVQNGAPTPSNPIQPSECEDRTANLCDKADFTIAANDDSKTELVYNGELDVGTYTVSLNQDNAITGSIRNTFRINIDGTLIHESPTDNYHNDAGQHIFTFTVSTKQTVEIYFWTHTLNDNCTYSQIMFNEGSTAKPFEPYGYKIPISSGGVTTNIYLGSTQTVRQIKKLVLTGEEGWVRTQNQKCYYVNASTGCPTDYLKQTITTSICSHYQSQNNTASGSNDVEAGHFCFYTAGGFELYIGETTISSVADFKAYLAAQYAAGTPVTIWYILATETTGIVNEPLRKIGDYADTVSKEQAGVEIPTASGSNTLDVDTTLKPSNVYIEYK